MSFYFGETIFYNSSSFFIIEFIEPIHIIIDLLPAPIGPSLRFWIYNSYDRDEVTLSVLHPFAIY